MLPACSFIWWLYMSGFKTTQKLLEETPRRAQEIIGNSFFMILVISAAVTPPLLLNREKIKNIILAGQQQRYVPLRRNLFYDRCLRDFYIVSWVWVESVYSGTGVCKAGNNFGGAWRCGKYGSGPCPDFWVRYGDCRGSMGNCYCTMLYLCLCNLFSAQQDYSGTPVPKQAAKEDCT